MEGGSTRVTHTTRGVRSHPGLSDRTHSPPSLCRSERCQRGGGPAESPPSRLCGPGRARRGALCTPAGPAGALPSGELPSRWQGRAGEAQVGEKQPRPFRGVSWLPWPIGFSRGEAQSETSAFGKLDCVQSLPSKSPHVKGDSAPKSNSVILQGKFVYDFKNRNSLS